MEMPAPLTSAATLFQGCQVTVQLFCQGQIPMPGELPQGVLERVVEQEEMLRS